MCGACGAGRAEWTERIAPLRPGAARRRARVLNALLATAPGTRRVRAHPWPGGGWRIEAPAGARFAASLPAAARLLVERHGNLIPVDEGDSSLSARCAAPVGCEVLAVWAAALAAGRMPRHGPVRIEAPAAALRISADGVDAGARDSGAADTAVHAPFAAETLARHLESLALDH